MPPTAWWDGKVAQVDRADHAIVEVQTGVSPQITTNYWISYDFAAATHRAWANYNNYVQAIFRDQMRVGSIQPTVNATGAGGDTGDHGDSGSGGSGSPGRPLPRN